MEKGARDTMRVSIHYLSFTRELSWSFLGLSIHRAAAVF